MTSQPKMSDKSCELPSVGVNKSAICVTMDRCSSLVDQEHAPENTILCGFDTNRNVIMVCCDFDLAEPRPSVSPPPPRFLGNNDLARKCEDRSELCEKWKQNGGCRLDKDIVIRGKCEEKKQLDWFSSSGLKIFDVKMGCTSSKHQQERK